MEEFLRKLNGAEVKVVLEHCLFDNQRFYCRQLQTISDDERIGIIIKDREIFMYKHEVNTFEVCGNTYKISDGRLTIIINKM